MGLLIFFLRRRRFSTTTILNDHKTPNPWSWVLPVAESKISCNVRLAQLCAYNDDKSRKGAPVAFRTLVKHKNLNMSHAEGRLSHCAKGSSCIAQHPHYHLKQVHY